MKTTKDFELPMVHIHQDIMPTIDHNKDTFEYSIQFIVQRHQKQVNAEIMKNIQQIMKEKGISEYYGIDENRLLEIVKEAKAFEIIKELINKSGIENWIYETENDYVFADFRISKEKYGILKEVLL